MSGNYLGMVRHSYFKKEMKSPLLLMQENAISDNHKFAFLSNELIRSVEQVVEGVRQDEKLKITEIFIQKMRNSGYERRNTREAVISGRKGFNTRIDMKHITDLINKHCLAERVILAW